MHRNRYVVRPGVTHVLGRVVTAGEDLWLTAGEATTPLGLRQVARPEDLAAEAVPRHPLDHDGDGRPGGSRRGARRRKGRG